jgi:hypothetical protein
MKKLFALYSAAALAWGVVFAGCSKAPPAGVDGRVMYEPDPELQDGVSVAMSRLEAASGVQFDVATGGTPVFATDPELMRECDKKDPTDCWIDCGLMTITFDKNTHQIYSVTIEIAWPVPDTCYSDVAMTIEHEMVHSARRAVDLTAGIHSPHGLFQLAANLEDHLLEETSLTSLCEGVDCSLFNPEVP